jgi:penicillin amidase
LKTSVKKGPHGAELLRRVAILFGLALVPFVLLAVVFITYVALGVHDGEAEPTGTIAGSGVRETVTVTRDRRGIPHVRARNEHDLFFAEGYLQGSDRLFQLDLYRRSVEGRLSEVFGSITLSSDVDARTIDVAGIAAAQFAALPPSQRANLEAFATGVNAAMATRPVPPEFRFLAYRPEPWKPVDSLAASFATVLALTDSWTDVTTRADVFAKLGPSARDAFFSISDPAYDTPAGPTARAALAPVAPLPALAAPDPHASPLYVAEMDARAGLGSNAFAAGAELTSSHRALLANDPHLNLSIPGVWWMADLSAPNLHVAGVTLGGVPGIVLGHNAHLAWGATNGTVATVRVFREHFRSNDSDEYRAGAGFARAEKRVETILVRFGKPLVRTYLRTRHGFVFDDRGETKLAAAWTGDLDRRSSFEQFDGLARATSVAAGAKVLARYPGPPQNFVLADDAGNVGYALAGDIPLDDAWGMAIHDGAAEAIVTGERDVPASLLPHVDASRSALVLTANARVYGRGYPYRLSAAFSPPYRAARIAEDLRSGPYDVARFAAVQGDVMSLPERELARATVAALERAHVDGDASLRDTRETLRGFDGRFTGDSRAAVVVTALRRAATERLVRGHMPGNLGRRYLSAEAGPAFVAVMRMLREKPRGWVERDDYDAFLVSATRDAIASLQIRRESESRWADVGARVAAHPLAAFGLKMWNGIRFPGLGSAYAPHVQAPGNAQSFRAVWDIGKWDDGGMVIPQGESGKPGSPHYRDAAPLWLQGDLVPFPFSDAAIERERSSEFALAP